MPVLYKILWKCDWNYFYLDDYSAYPHEKEFLIHDGVMFHVVNVSYFDNSEGHEQAIIEM